MGRSSTGAYTTGDCLRLELSKLKKQGFLKKNCISNGIVKWTNGARIELAANMAESCPYLTLSYVITDNETKEQYKYCYDILLAKRPSNLGKGEVLYFICPYSGKKCRILYKAYGYHKWKCREAYQNRIYYPSQVSSKKGKYNDRYWELEHKLDEYRKGRKSYTYKGKETKRATRIMAMINERNRMDEIRWSAIAMPKALLKLTNGRNIWDC